MISPHATEYYTQHNLPRIVGYPANKNPRPCRDRTLPRYQHHDISVPSVSVLSFCTLALRVLMGTCPSNDGLYLITITPFELHSHHQTGPSPLAGLDFEPASTKSPESNFALSSPPSCVSDRPYALLLACSSIVCSVRHFLAAQSYSPFHILD